MKSFSGRHQDENCIASIENTQFLFLSKSYLLILNFSEAKMSIACYTNKKTLMHFKCSYKIRLLYIVRDFYRFLE